MTSEISAVRFRDVDAPSGRVWLTGGSKREPRWAALIDWGRVQLERHLRSVDPADSPDFPLVYRGSGSEESRQASSCQAISVTLVRAGLRNEPDVRPASLPAWAGATTFAATGRIETVAKAMGLRSLDQAARAIGWDWFASSG